MLRFLYISLVFLVTIAAQRLSVELCDTLQCVNRGICFEVLDRDDGIRMDPQCLCPSNFTGTLCETAVPCDRSCLNGGTCQYGESWWLEDEFFLREILETCSYEPGGLNLLTCEAWEIAGQYCQCRPNVYGSNCETVCDLQCENNGSCDMWGNNQARCRCEYPYFGDLCQESCSKDCQNGGYCVAYDINNDTIMEQTCLCPANFAGDLCETPKPCSKACVNGGTCQQESNWWFEEAEYFGEIFDRIFYDCQGSFNTSECYDLDAMEYCLCPPDTFGEFCQVTCDLECLNEGSCEVQGNQQRCRCQPGFLGEICEEVCDLECSNGGRCVAYDSDNDTIKEKHCFCPFNYTGHLCTEPRQCQLQCLNGGVCEMEAGWWPYEDPEFLEEVLDEMIANCYHDNIFSDPLDHDQCMGTIIGEYCKCPPNVWGSQCEYACDLDCGANGNCNFTSGFRDKWCSCRPGYSGQSCQYECTLNCQNNGLCVSDGSSEYCQCSPFFEGDRCQTKKSCSKSCANGGTCVFTGGYNEEYYLWCLNENNDGDCPELDSFELCECPPGWVGSDCSEPCPCKNGGTCSTWRHRELQSSNWTVGEYNNGTWTFPDVPPDYIGPDDKDEWGHYCNCPFGFYGNQCQFELGDKGCSIQCSNGGYCEKRDFVWGGVGDDSMGAINNYYDEQDHDHSDAEDGSNPIDRERCVCPANFTGPTCGEVLDPCFNMCQNGVCKTSSSTSTQRFGGRSLESVLFPDPDNPNFDHDHDAHDFGPGHNAYDDFGPGHFGAFCQCDEGYSGLYCEREACGSGYCANGAACIELPSGQTTPAGDDYVCDCTVATLGAGFDDTTFIGRQCDGEVYHECFSDDENPNENWACANYGRCFYDASGPQCHCDWGWQGPRCETNSSDTRDIAWGRCMLPCMHGGTCLKGVVKPIASIFSKFLEPTKKSKLFDYAPSTNYEYCYCPTGFFGVECEKQYELCGDGEHICFHGSTCGQTGGEWTCDCTGTETAGLYCMYEATDDCGDSNVETFCTNGSTCGADKKCSCLEGWEGDKCEVEVKAATIQGENEKWSDAKLTRPVAILLLIISFATLVVM